MADSREPFVWSEMTLYLWQGGTSALLAFAENVEMSVDDSYQKFLYQTTGVRFGSRSEYVLTDRNARVTVGRLYAGASLLDLMESGVNISAVVPLINNADQVTAQFTLYSARISHYQNVGRAANLWRDSVTIIAPDFSGI